MKTFLLFVANTQQSDIFGALLKPLLPYLIILTVVKILVSFLPMKQHTRKIASKNTNHSKSRKNQEEKLIMIGVLIMILSLAQLFVKRYRFGSIAFWVIGLAFSIFFIGVGVFLLWLKKNKGRIGEMIVSSRLIKGLPQDEYFILNDLYLPIEDGRTTQIDHIVVSRFGIFVVETKNYTGWIFADAASKVWTQTIYHEKNTFQNPIRQNYRHICAISDNLGIPAEYIRGVAFTGDCQFKTPMPEGVVYSKELAYYIKSFSTPLLKDREKHDIIDALREWDASVTDEQRASHIENLKKSHQ